MRYRPYIFELKCGKWPGNIVKIIYGLWNNYFLFNTSICSSKQPVKVNIETQLYEAWSKSMAPSDPSGMKFFEVLLERKQWVQEDIGAGSRWLEMTNNSDIYIYIYTAKPVYNKLGFLLIHGVYQSASKVWTETHLLPCQINLDLYQTLDIKTTVMFII